MLLSRCGSLLYGVGMILLLTTPLLLGFWLDWQIAAAISTYSFANLLHFVLQFAACLMNRKQCNVWHESMELHPDTSYGVLVVGRQENPTYFRACLEAIAKLAGPPRKIWVVIDGDHPEDDLYMVDIVSEVFTNTALLVNCVAQAAAGKRAAMFRALAQETDVDYMLCTDSDTVIQADTALNMKRLLDNLPKAAAVTGNVRIFNLGNFLSHMINMKYWFAFNLERAAQSYFGCVSCVSGPLGMYRMAAIRPLLESWRYQRFCCQEATYGDDRHLTNLLLAAGHKIYYTHHAECSTETPDTYLRWFTQQARWGRSFVREFIINVAHFWRISWWLTYDLIYLTFYSLFLFVYVIVMLLGGPAFDSLVTILLASLLIALLRALYGLIMERSVRFLLFAWFGVLYFLTLLPLKIWSACTVWLVTWGTSMRREIHKGLSMAILLDSWPVGLWLVFVGQAVIRAAIAWHDWAALGPQFAALGSFCGLSMLVWWCG